jgi:hypothetical protein
MNTSYCPSEVAQMAAISTRAVLMAIRTGQLVAYRYSERTIRISPDAVAEWQARCQIGAVLTLKASTGSKRRHSCT